MSCDGLYEICNLTARNHAVKIQGRSVEDIGLMKLAIASNVDETRNNEPALDYIECICSNDI